MKCNLPLFSWVACAFGVIFKKPLLTPKIEFCDFFMYSAHESFVRLVIGKYFLLVLSFHSLNSVFSSANMLLRNSSLLTAPSQSPHWGGFLTTLYHFPIEKHLYYY